MTCVPSVRTGNCKGCEREGARGEKYQVVFKNTENGKNDECPFGEARWKGIAVGSKWAATVGVIDGTLRCGDLKPE